LKRISFINISRNPNSLQDQIVQIQSTSNVGAEMLRKQGSLGFIAQTEEITHDDMKNRLLEEVKKSFKPEFLNRVDDIIVFKSLSKESLYDIVKIEVQGVSNRLAEREMNIEITKEALEFLIDKGFDPVYGARPLKRTIQRYIEDPLAEMLIEGKFEEGSTIKAVVKNDSLSFE